MTAPVVDVDLHFLAPRAMSQRGGPPELYGARARLPRAHGRRGPRRAWQRSPFWMGDPEPLAVVRDAGLTVEAQAAIRGANATRLFRLDAAR
jgi:hypothetical protein